MSSVSFAYDAVALLGFGPASTDPLAAPIAGEVVIRYGGWTLQELRDSGVGKRLMHQQNWYDKSAWSKEAPSAGIYRLRVPVPGSNRKTASEQDAMLVAGETPAPVVLVATALLCHRLQTKGDLLNGDWTRCLEQMGVGVRVGLSWNDGRLGAYDCWVGSRSGYLWASSVRTS